MNASSFLLRFEAIESRIAALKCPIGTPGRIHSLRLRRAQQSSRQSRIRSATTLSSERSLLSSFNNADDTHSLHHEYQHSAADNGLFGNALINTDNARAGHKLGSWPVTSRDTAASQLGISGRLHPSIKKIATSRYAPLISLDPDYLAHRLQIAVQSGQHNRVLHEILRQINFVNLHQYAREVLPIVPATTFSELLSALSPQQHIDRFSQLYEEVSPVWAKNLKLPQPNAFGRHEFLIRFLKQISVILSSRAISNPLCVQDYKILLQCARAVGDPDAAKAIWQQLQHHIFEETVKADKNPLHEVPIIDVECYNHYMAALCWSDVLNPYHRHHLRVSARNLARRTTDSTDFHLSGHRVGPGGLKSTVATLFQRMVQAKISPNEETFCLMAVAIAREGELDSVSSLLNSAWGLDVEAILSGQSTEGQQPRQYDPSDPLIPSGQLLMTLAHAYSVNKSITAAIQLIDHVSQQYNIPISMTVWKELLERSVMLSSPNTDEPETRIERVAVSNLFRTMTSKPYNVVPDIRMYNFLIGSELRQQRFGGVQEWMAEAMKVHHADTEKLSNLINAQFTQGFHSKSDDVRRRQARDIEYQHLRVKVNRLYIRRWIRLLFYNGSRSLGRSHHASNFSSRNVPYVVERYASYLPRVVKYKTATGCVQLHSLSGMNNRLRRVQHARSLRAKRESPLIRRPTLMKTILKDSRQSSSKQLPPGRKQTSLSTGGEALLIDQE